MLMNQSLGMGFVIMKQLHMFVPMMMVIVQVRNIEELNVVMGPSQDSTSTRL